MKNQEDTTRAEINIAAVSAEVSRYFDRCESYHYSELKPFPAEIRAPDEQLDWIVSSIKDHVTANSFFDPAQAASLDVILLDDLAARSDILFSLPVTWRDPSHPLYGGLAELFYEDSVLEDFFVKHQLSIRDRRFRSLIKPQAVLTSALDEVVDRLAGHKLIDFAPVILDSIDHDRLAENFRLHRTAQVETPLYDQTWLLC